MFLQVDDFSATVVGDFLTTNSMLREFSYSAPDENAKSLEYKWGDTISVHTDYIQGRKQEIVMGVVIHQSDQDLYNMLPRELRTRIEMESKEDLLYPKAKISAEESDENAIHINFGHEFGPKYSVTFKEGILDSLQCSLSDDLE